MTGLISLRSNRTSFFRQATGNGQEARHSGESRNPGFLIPRNAGLDPGFRRVTSQPGTIVL